MSCGLRDVVNLEIAGRPTVLVHSEAFRESAARQVEMLGQPDLRRAIVAHPVQDRTDEQVRALARGALDAVLRALLRD